MHAPEWRIQTFGGMRVLRLGKELPRFETRKAAAVFATLALDLGRTRSRDELAERFWSGEYADLQRSSLRQALASIRKTLGDTGRGDDAFVQADRLGVRLNPALCTCDVHEFAALAKQVNDKDSQQKAVGLYLGPLLPEMTHPDVVALRRQLHDDFVSVSIRVSEQVSTEDVDAALQILARALENEPTSERAISLKVKLLSGAGRRTEAMAALRDFEENLRSELGIEMSLELRAIAENLKGSPRQRLVLRPSRPSLPEFRSNVSRPLTPIFGRGDEIARLKVLTAPGSSERVTTVIGPGGIGKTRLSLEIAWLQLDAYDGGVWFVPLTEAANASEIPARVIDALELRPSSESEVEQIARHFQGRPALVVLDNFEHLVELGVAQVKDLLDRCPGLKLMVTSREGLNVGFDTEVAIHPLETPTANSPDPEKHASVELFLDRARQAGSNIELNEDTRPAIVAICERLEGIPLSIVLAGARAQNRTADEILAALDHRLDFLAADRRDLPGRRSTRTRDPLQRQR